MLARCTYTTKHNNIDAHRIYGFCFQKLISQFTLMSVCKSARANESDKYFVKELINIQWQSFSIHCEASFYIQPFHIHLNIVLPHTICECEHMDPGRTRRKFNSYFYWFARKSIKSPKTDTSRSFRANKRPKFPIYSIQCDSLYIDCKIRPMQKVLHDAV